MAEAPSGPPPVRANSLEARGLSSAELERTHPYYDERVAQWHWSYDHYLGGLRLGNLVSRAGTAVSSGARPASYLVKFANEDETSYVARLQRAPGLYDNLVKKAIQVYLAQIFRTEPKRTLGAALEDLVEDVDLYGTDAQPFFEKVARFTQLFGVYHVLVDATSAETFSAIPTERRMSEYEARAAGVRPYFEALSPLQVRNWDVEYRDPSRRGRLNWLVICDAYPVAEYPGAERRMAKRYRVWTREEWGELIYFEGESKEKRGNLYSERYGFHDFGEVPLVTFYEDRECPMQGNTVFDDIVLATNALWQRASAEDEAFLYQAFNILKLKLQNPDKYQITISASRALLLHENEEAEYLTPSDAPFQAFEAFVARTHERITDLVFARTSRQQPSAQVESAEKRDIDRAEFIALLETKSSGLEDGERKCWELAAAALGRELDVELEYPREFSVEDTPTIDWQTQVQEFVASRLDWYKSLHPGADDATAEKALAENMAFEQRLTKKRLAFEQAQMAAFQERTGALMGGEEEEGEEGEDGEGAEPMPRIPGGVADKVAKRLPSRRPNGAGAES